MSSIRTFTSEQFSDGTTIDSNRIEKALQDLERYINDVPDGDFRSRWLQSQMILRYLPFTAEADANLATGTGTPGDYLKAPWQQVYQAGAGITNAYRLKGNRLPWQEAFDAGTDRQVAWTTAVAVGDEPVVLDAIDVSMASYSSEYQNTYEYDSSPPENQTPNSPVDDIHLELTMDNPFIPNIQILNSVLFHKYNFSALNSKMTAAGLAYTIPADINPTMSSVGMGAAGDVSLFIQVRELGIPIPPGSRLRFSLILSNDFAGGAGYQPWGLKPWQTFVPTMSLTLLERLERD